MRLSRERFAQIAASNPAEFVVQMVTKLLQIVPVTTRDYSQAVLSREDYFEAEAKASEPEI